MPRGDLIPLSGFGRGWHVAPNGHNTRTLSRANLSLPGVGVFLLCTPSVLCLAHEFARNYFFSMRTSYTIQTYTVG